MSVKELCQGENISRLALVKAEHLHIKIKSNIHDKANVSFHTAQKSKPKIFMTVQQPKTTKILIINLFCIKRSSG